jgi:hypothetical protein
MSQPSQPVPPINPYDAPETARPGMSSGAKVLLGLGIGCGVLVLLCCGIGGVSLYFLGRNLQKGMSEDPATVREVAENIVTIEVPESLEPKMSLDFTIPFVNRRMMSMAVFASQDKHSTLVLFEVDQSMGGNEEVMQAQFKDAMRQSGREHRGEVELEEPEDVEAEINGNQTEFRFGKGKHENREVWQATGAFSGKGGPAMLFMQLDAETFNKEQALDILHSMQ